MNQANPMEVLIAIYDQLKDIDPEDMTKAEKNIIKLLQNNFPVIMFSHSL